MSENSDQIWGVKAWYVGGALAVFVVVLTAIFVLMSYSQFSSIRNDTQRLLIGNSASAQIGSITGKTTNPDMEKFRVLAELEWQGMIMRSDRTAIALEMRTWLRFLLAFYGMMLVAIGSVFVLGYVSSPKFVARAEAGDLKFALATTSPGLVLAVAGCILMSVSAIVNQPIDTREQAAFVHLSASPMPTAVPNKISHTVPVH